MLSTNAAPTNGGFPRVHICDVPIHKLNADVLLHVFTICRDIEPVSVWCISRTSSRWRKLTLEHSVLWTLVTVDQPTIRFLGSTHPLAWLRTWLSRSYADQELDIAVDLHDVGMWRDCIRPTAEDMDNVLLELCYSAYRWGSFTYRLGRQYTWASPGDWDFRALIAVLENMKSLPLLRTIYLWEEEGFLDSALQITPGLLYQELQPKATPQLRRVSLGTLPHSRKSGTDTCNVDHLSYQVRQYTVPRDVLSLLRTYNSTRILQLSGWSGVVESGHDGAVTLDNLHELQVVPNAFMADVLSAVDMPCLTRLTLDGRLIPYNEEVMSQTAWDPDGKSRYSTSFLDVLSLRPHTLFLTCLVLYLPLQSVPWSSMANFETLETVTIVKTERDTFWSNCPSNLSMLYEMKKPGDIGSRWCLPQLHTLTLQATAGGKSEKSALPAASGWHRWQDEAKALFWPRWLAAKENNTTLVYLGISVIATGIKIELRQTED